MYLRVLHEGVDLYLGIFLEGVDLFGVRVVSDELFFHEGEWKIAGWGSFSSLTWTFSIKISFAGAEDELGSPCLSNSYVPA